MTITDRTRNLPLFPSGRDGQTLEEALEESIEALKQFGKKHNHWVMSYSGGKDSTATVTTAVYAIKNGFVEPPKSLIILRADTRQESPILDHNAELFMGHLRKDGIDARTVMAPISKRFWVQILGRGLPPPSNRLRWCTRALKVDPMKVVVDDLSKTYGEKFLMITGVRTGESAARDQHLVKSLERSEEISAPVCSVESGECGTGIWLDKSLSKSYDALPLILHWRTCHIYDWLHFYTSWHGYPETKLVAKMYGQYDDGTLEEDGSRYGCFACDLVTKDKMLLREAKQPGGEYALILLELKEIKAEMRQRQYRLRGGGRAVVKDPERLGPLTIEARQYFLDKVLDVQTRSGISIINTEEETEIRRMWEAKVYPQGWTGDEDNGLSMKPLVYKRGKVQAIQNGLFQEKDFE